MIEVSSSALYLDTQIWHTQHCRCSSYIFHKGTVPNSKHFLDLKRLKVRKHLISDLQSFVDNGIIKCNLPKKIGF